MLQVTWETLMLERPFKNFIDIDESDLLKNVVFDQFWKYAILIFINLIELKFTPCIIELLDEFYQTYHILIISATYAVNEHVEMLKSKLPLNHHEQHGKNFFWRNAVVQP